MSSTRRTALVFGVLFLATFVFSIGGVILYNPVLHPADFIAGTGGDTRVRFGRILRSPSHRCERRHGRGGLSDPQAPERDPRSGYVTARLVECTFIAIGVVSLLAVVTLRQKAGGEDPGSLVADARTLVAVRDWTFVLGPGFIVGIGNGLILGYLMYTSGLVPRGLAVLGLIGGPLICISGLAVVLDLIDRGGVAQGIATVPEFLWELSLGIYPIVKGFKASPILEAGFPASRSDELA
jgi:hypothetical protein